MKENGTRNPCVVSTEAPMSALTPVLRIIPNAASASTSRTERSPGGVPRYLRSSHAPSPPSSAFANPKATP